MSKVRKQVVKALSEVTQVIETRESLPNGKPDVKNTLSAGDTTAQTFDDSFTEVTQKRSRRENKLLTKEKIQEDRLSKKLSGPAQEQSFKEPAPKFQSRTDDESENNTLTEEDNMTSFECTMGGTDLGLSKKKRQYLEQEIIDRSGAYNYAEDPSTYKKARKRLQNRESAVRSRMKKRQEMEVLEEEVRKLQEQKAAIESANDELKRQNKYWEDLFAKQQLQSVVPVSVVQTQQPQPQPQQQQPEPVSQGSGLNSMSDFTRSDQEFSDFGAENSLDPSFTTLRMRSDRGSKRQKRSDSGEMGGMFEFDRSHELEADILENTFDRDIMAPPRSVEIPPMSRQLSIGEIPERQTSLNFDDCFLERQPRNDRGNFMFFGLALVFGAVGTVTSLGSSHADTSVDGSKECYSGLSLKNSDALKAPQSMPLKHGDDYEEVTQVSLDPSSTSQNLSTALRLLLQALKTVPMLTQISFALSLLFLVLYLNPFGSLLSSGSSSNPKAMASPVQLERVSTSRSGTSVGAEQNKAQGAGRKSRASSGKRRQK